MRQTRRQRDKFKERKYRKAEREENKKKNHFPGHYSGK